MKIDAELKNSIELMTQGNQEGFTLFYNQTYNFVYKRARFIMKNDEDALDLTQETFIQAYKGISSLQDINKVYSWLSSVTYNQGMRMFDKKRDVIVSEEAEEIFDNIVSTDMDTSPEAAAQTKATSEIIKNMIEELPELQKMALLAFYYDNMKIDDIAVMFECSSNTIKSRLNYAKKALHEKVLAHEKVNNYKLCSVSPVVIFMALEALFATKKYSMPAASVEALCAGAQGTLFASNASAATAVSAATSTGAKVGLSLTAKAAIAITTVATATAIAVAAATGGFSNAGSTPTESEISSELDSSSESEIPSGSEALVEEPLASIYDVQYTSYADSGDYLIMVTEGIIGNSGDKSEGLTTESDIYILGKDGACLSFHNKNEDGSIKYLTIEPFKDVDKALAIVMVKGNYKNLLLPDGSLFDETTKFRNFHHTNGFIVALTSSDAGQTYNIYDSDLNLLKEDISDFGSITRCETFGEYTIVRGVATDSQTFIQCIYDQNWNRVDYIEANGNASNVTLVMDGTYLWAGDTLRDQNYNEVTIPIPDYIRPNGEQVIINHVSNGMFSSNYASVKVSVTDATGTTTSKYYLIDTDFNTYTDETQTEDFVWVELEGITIMYDVSAGERYAVLNDTGQRLYGMLDWHERINEVYGPSGIYGIDGNLYTDGSVLAWVAANVNSTGDIQSSTFLLKKEDGYSIDKAINLDVELSYTKGLYYSPNTKQIYLNHTLVNYHSILFNEKEGYYILQNEDGTFTVYRPDQTVHFTTSKNLVCAFNENYFLAESSIDGTTYYQLLSKQNKHEPLVSLGLEEKWYGTYPVVDLTIYLLDNQTLATPINLRTQQSTILNYEPVGEAATWDSLGPWGKIPYSAEIEEILMKYHSEDYIISANLDKTIPIWGGEGNSEIIAEHEGIAYSCVSYNADGNQRGETNLFNFATEEGALEYYNAWCSWGCEDYYTDYALEGNIFYYRDMSDTSEDTSTATPNQSLKYELLRYEIAADTHCVTNGQVFQSLLSYKSMRQTLPQEVILYCLEASTRCQLVISQL